MTQVLVNLHENSEMPVTPLLSCISVPELILFSTIISPAGKTISPMNQTPACLHPLETWG